MSDEWGPWIEHDGRGFPETLSGQVLMVIGEQPCGGRIEQIGVVHNHTCRRAWDWRNFGKIDYRKQWVNAKVVAYRIRKPRGLTILEEIAQGVKQPEEA